MVSKKKDAAKKGSKLKLRRETLKDLDVRGNAVLVKGGQKTNSNNAACSG
jgi:hypothetical protein